MTMNKSACQFCVVMFLIAVDVNGELFFFYFYSIVLHINKKHDINIVFIISFC